MSSRVCEGGRSKGRQHAAHRTETHHGDGDQPRRDCSRDRSAPHPLQLSRRGSEGRSILCAIGPHPGTSHGCQPSSRFFNADPEPDQCRSAVDGNLADDPNDPVRIFGKGVVGSSARAFSLLAWPSGQTLDVLRTPIHAGGELQLNGVLDVRGGPASSNAAISTNGRALLGDVEAQSLPSPADVTGSKSVPAPMKPMPSRLLFDLYANFASEIKFTDTLGRIAHAIISPRHHPYNLNDINPDGLYRIKVASASTLTVHDCRIEGTLLVELLAGARLEIGSNMLWKPYRPDFPALIVYTQDDLSTTVTLTCDGTLSESQSLVNFNPPDLPYYGDGDSDVTDTYPASLRGLIHIIRNTALPPLSATHVIAPNRITGCIVADGPIRIQTASIIAADPQLLAHPPLGYTVVRPPTNLLSNADFEAGLANWTAVGSGTTLVWSGTKHAGSNGLEIKGRSSAAGGVRQDITSSLLNGQTYDCECWLKMNDRPEDVNLALEVDSSGAGTQRFAVVVVGVQKDWTRVRVALSPAWVGTLNYGRLVITTTTTAQTFYMDDAMIRDPQQQLPPSLLPVAGTWRPELAD